MGHDQPDHARGGCLHRGELEVVAHLERGLPIVDSRRPEFLAAATIRGARNVPHTETAARGCEFDPEIDTVLFCNGLQCAATPRAIQLPWTPVILRRLLYYRGGMHDWTTLGLPSVPGDR